MKRLIPWSIPIFLALAGPHGAAAKTLARLIGDIGLSPADHTLLSAAADSLFLGNPPTAGDRQSWTNPDTGSNGSVQVEEVRDNCAIIRHEIVPGGDRPRREIRTRRCRNAEGKWLLAP